MNTAEQITIEFTPEQKQLILEKCGLNPQPIVTDLLSLSMLSLAARAARSETLPLVDHIKTAKLVLDPKTGEKEKPYTITLEATGDQRELLQNAVHHDWRKLMLFPEEWEVRYIESWQVNQTALRIGDAFVIAPENGGHKPAANELTIWLPQAGENEKTFGRGNHPTTQLSLYLMQRHLKAGDRVLDVGTGSGILAVGAALLGAESVLAFDIDGEAVEMAKKTVALNRLADKIEVAVTELPKVEGVFDSILANVFPKIIKLLANDLAEKIKADGVLVVSGIVSSRKPEIIAVLEDAGFTFVESRTLDIWDGLVFNKNNVQPQANSL